jgi:glycosyltransferase involved in cell wall biosynthesis
MVSISVIIPTYRRPSDLNKCLEALKLQTRSPDEVIVVVRSCDRQTHSFLLTYESASLPLKVVQVIDPGQVAALNMGLKESQGDIVSFTDDDGVPHPHWLKLIEANFLADEQVGGVGGRDWMYVGNQLVPGESNTVGKVQWFGRTIGNHHLGIGDPRSVEILKGANMSYRCKAIANQYFDTRLLGSGAEVHNDLAFALQVKKAGWKLIYDPLVEIDHYHGQRFDEDRRGEFNQVAWFNEVYNKTLVMLEYLPPLRRAAFLLWTFLIGSRRGYGIVQLFRFLPQEGGLAVKKWLFSLKARQQACLTWLKMGKQIVTAEVLHRQAEELNLASHDVQSLSK